MNDSAHEYPWHTAGQSCAQEYVLGPLLRMLGPPRGRYLDLGCGNGAVARELLRRGFDVVGVDASSSGVEIANSLHPGRFHQMDIGAGALPAALRDTRFTAVIATEVIEHLYAPRQLLKVAREALNRGGHLILSTPYHGYLKNLALAITGALDQHFTALGDGGHIKFFSRRTLEGMLKECGFEPVQFQGAGRMPYLWKSMVVKARLIEEPGPKVPSR